MGTSVPGDHPPALARRIAVELLIPELVRSGQTAQTAYESLRGTPLGIRKQTFLDLWRDTVEHLARAQTIGRLDPDQLPGENLMRLRRGTRREPYQYRVAYLTPSAVEPRSFAEARAGLAPPGVLKRGAVIVNSEVVLTPAQAIAQAQLLLSDTIRYPTPYVAPFVDRIQKFMTPTGL